MKDSFLSNQQGGADTPENYEALGDERFQLFCAALLQRDHPHLQCFPVGQPDGGRDATEGGLTTTQPAVVFQVKFSRNPARIADPVAWLTSTLRAEAPKVSALAERGAQKYYLITNLLGSAHLGGGQIDRVADILATELPIPAQCLWRTDLDVRLSNAGELRWEYVELLNPGQLLQRLAGAVPSGDGDRVQRVIRAYIASTYEDEQKLRFRQIDLSDDLIGLYVDVPLDWQRLGRDRDTALHHYAKLTQIAETLSYVADADDEDSAPLDAGRETFSETLTALSNPRFQSEFPVIVVEGGPGQGKSTVAQYLCQLNRIRILELGPELARLPASHLTGAIRIPFRLDLRTLASWLQGDSDPFAPDSDTPPLDWHASLEGFLAAHVRHRAGGQVFTLDDLCHAVARAPVLLVLDGLDEVADIALRARVIDEALDGIQRLTSMSPSLQVVITSRPAAFAKSPGFSKDRIPHFSLSTINTVLALAYAERWAAAKALSSEERIHVLRVLRGKLQQPHIRSLTQTPMQLAILLNLITTFGESLPDARTALYDEYVKLFLNREAEKTAAVKKHRPLLIDVHRFVAWTLHSQSELGRHTEVAIPVRELRALLFAYLDSENQPTDIVDELFMGMIERVVFLVQRGDGKYGFDVQPLQEYFCARHLYDTAPSAIAGRRAGEAAPDRFEVIARNPYWLNVTRFFAGCYTKGELTGLAESLVEYYHDAASASTSYPRQLLTMLLTDFVFDGVPRAANKAVGALVSDFGSRHALGLDDRSRRGRLEALTLPPRAGRDELLDRSWELLTAEPALDSHRRRSLCWVIRANTAAEGLKAAWLKAVCTAAADARTRWIEHGGHMGVLAALGTSDARAIISGSLSPAIGEEAGLQVASLIRFGAAPALEADDTLSIGRWQPYSGPRQMSLQWRQALRHWRFSLAWFPHLGSAWNLG